MASHLIWGRPEPIDDDSGSSISSSRHRSAIFEHVEFRDDTSASSGTAKEQLSVSDSDTLGGNLKASSTNVEDCRVAAGISDPADACTASVMMGGQPASASMCTDLNRDPSTEGQRKAFNEQEELHIRGECKPCAYVHSKTGCLSASKCRFCHFEHQRINGNRHRPCKAKRHQCKKIVQILHSLFDEESAEFQVASDRVASESAYMRSILGKSDQRPDSGYGEISEQAGESQAGESGACFGEHAAAMLSGHYYKEAKTTPNSMPMLSF